MLNRRILRIKAFKVLYAYAENPEMSLKEAVAALDASCEATRSLYLQLMGVVIPLTAHAARLTEAARSKFNPTPEEANPNMKFVNNALAPLLESDPDFVKLSESRKLGWSQDDAFIHSLYTSMKSKVWFEQYMNAPGASLAQDIQLFKHMFEDEFEDNPAVEAIVEDRSMWWTDELSYALMCCIKSLDAIGRDGRWELPPLYQSELLEKQGRRGVESDSRFVHTLLEAAFGRYREYEGMIAGAVSKWDRDRLYTTDIVLVALGLAEAEVFPEIPVKVSINEYVEISKYYSTPKSRSFVNGLLDHLVKQLAGEGRVNKTI